ncbi:hypothetical protein LQV63_24510 [Paenibacillus profundus]|uniref:Uncharacterized protein n=1 Tax=Paenibacillus profundus TaxID=1173085 RepID=A0ABS8YKP6_9BACL|nr:hypothetical protein [Paenibacillus profundus]MCE5172443.1 hypothetical protein [Paenibacillus profundus]
MILINIYESNELKSPLEETKIGILSTLSSLNYTLPIEEAKAKYNEVLGLDCPDFKPRSSYEQRMIFEMGFLYGSSGGGRASWSSFFKLSNKIDYGIIKILDSEESEPKSKKAEKKAMKISMTFLSIDSSITEIDLILETLKNKRFGIEEWKKANKRNEKFDELSLNYESPLFTEHQNSVARKLSDSQNQNILLAIKSSGSLIVRDLRNKFENIDDISTRIEQLKEDDLIKSEYVVLCKKTSEQLNKAPTRESIDIMGQHGIKCSKCNRLIADEIIEELLTTTSSCNKMLDGSLWMTIILVDKLLSFGIPLDEILVNIEEGPEEIDAIITIGENLLLFELKDSQFSLGHAYAFQSRLGVYNADTGVIWATKGIAPEVKEHFNKVKPDASLCYIESFESLTSKLGEIIDNIRWDIAEDEMKNLNQTTLMYTNIGGGIVKDLKQSSLTLLSMPGSKETPELING